MAEYEEKFSVPVCATDLPKAFRDTEEKSRATFSHFESRRKLEIFRKVHRSNEFRFVRDRDRAAGGRDPFAAVREPTNLGR